MTRTIDNGKEEKLAAERKKKAQEQKHTELNKLYEDVLVKQSAAEEANKTLVSNIDEHKKNYNQLKNEFQELMTKSQKLSRENEKLREEDSNRGK